MLASAAARFSSLTAAQISCRYTGISDGASIPSLTVEPTTSSTVMVTSSPRQIRSPGLRVITSILASSLAGCGDHGYGGRRRAPPVQLHLGKEGVPNRVPADVVDDLPTDTRVRIDHERTGEVDRAVGRLLRCAHDADDVRIAGVVEPEALRLVVGHAHLVVAVEQPRRGHGDGDIR